jgi:O-antigen ligase
MMLRAAAKDSYILRLAGRLQARLTVSARDSLFFRLLLSSRITAWLAGRLPLTAGVSVGILFIIPHNYFNNFYSLLIMIFLIVLLFISAMRGQEIKLPRMSGYAAVYWLMVAAALLNSRSFNLSLRFFLFHLTAFLALIVIQSVYTDKRSLARLAVPLMAAVSVSGLYGLLQSVMGVEIDISQVDMALNENMPGRVFSFYENPNNFAAILVLTLPLFAAFFFSAGSMMMRRLAALSALPPAMALVLTFSRSGWLAFGLAMVIFFFFTYRWVVPLLLAAALAAAPLLPVSIRERLLSTFTGTDSSILYRSSIREAAYPVLRGNWLFGMGLGADSVRDEILSYYRANPHAGSRLVAAHMHHLYLQLWVELGILGAASFCGAMLVLLKRGAAALFAPVKKNFILAAGLSGIAGALLMGFAEFIFFYPRVLLLFWVIAGITTAALRAGQAEQTDP